MSDRDALVSKIEAQAQKHSNRPTQPRSAAGQPQTKDYTRSDFAWSDQIKRTARDIWDIQSFRLSQEAAINASMDGRDVVCVMPTGGGKSLIYQLPAILSENGTTVVITPLISLMADQVHNLRQVDISCEQLNAATSQGDMRAIMKRMVGDVAAGKGKPKATNGEPLEGRPKLVYVTPERIDKSKTFVATLQKMYDAGGVLSRFVIDEGQCGEQSARWLLTLLSAAHCISTLGHDYRTSYQSLRRLKALFPTVPILCVTATSPAAVTRDILKTLGLPQTTSPGHAALPKTTILFESPLYRPNLIYEVLTKPATLEAQVQAIVERIESRHVNDIGIVYCLVRTHETSGPPTSAEF